MLSKLNTLILLVLFLFIFVSCKEQTTKKEDGIILHLPDGFVDFYEKFHSDSLFQLEHIVFPLSGRLKEGGEVDYWMSNDWIMHKEFDTGFSNYDREYAVFNEIVIENITDSFGAFSMERRFAKVLDGWQLIYYNVVYKKPNLK